MARGNQILGGVVMCAFIMGVAGSAWSDTSASPSENGRLRKLGRGLANVITCPFELVRTPLAIGHRDGDVAAVTVGIVEGAWRTVCRGVIGVYEIATFYSEHPKGFAPIIQPEFVWAQGSWVE